MSWGDRIAGLYTFLKKVRDTTSEYEKAEKRRNRGSRQHMRKDEKMVSPW